MWSRWFPEPADALCRRGRQRAVPGPWRHQMYTYWSAIMEPASPASLPADVLVVEDDPLLRLDLEDTLLNLGVKRVRSAANTAQALRMIADRVPEVALLDVGLVRETSLAIALRLDELGVPFAFVTGYDSNSVPEAFADRPRLAKPCSTAALLALLQRFGASPE